MRPQGQRAAFRDSVSQTARQESIAILRLLASNGKQSFALRPILQILRFGRTGQWLLLGCTLTPSWRCRPKPVPCLSVEAGALGRSGIVQASNCGRACPHSEPDSSRLKVPFEFALARSCITLTIPSGKSILEVICGRRRKCAASLQGHARRTPFTSRAVPQVGSFNTSITANGRPHAHSAEGS